MQINILTEGKIQDIAIASVGMHLSGVLTTLKLLGFEKDDVKELVLSSIDGGWGAFKATVSESGAGHD